MLEGELKQGVVTKLHQILRPFLLRRLKADVEIGLPKKYEYILFAWMTEWQSEMYSDLLAKNLHDSTGKQVRLNNVLMQLRKVCNHPYLFEGAEPGPPFVEGEHLIHNSGKLAVLDKLLKRLKEGGHRVLIFCTMTRMVDILQDYFEYRRYDYCRLDGTTSTTEREEMMADFNAKDSDKFLFMLSTRAHSHSHSHSYSHSHSHSRA